MSETRERTATHGSFIDWLITSFVVLLFAAVMIGGVAMVFLLDSETRTSAFAWTDDHWTSIKTWFDNHYGFEAQVATGLLVGGVVVAIAILLPEKGKKE